MRLQITPKLVVASAFMLLSTTFSIAQNTLLQQPSTGMVSSAFDGMELVSNGNDVVLVASASSDTAIYAIDIADNNPADVVNNTVTTIPNFKSLLSGVAGVSSSSITIIAKAFHIG